MERHRIIVLVLISLITITAYTQDGSTPGDTQNVYTFKLDYNVPESPAFAVLDANPTTILRASTPQEIVTHLASNFLSGNEVSPGLALDFNPYLTFGGRLKSVKEYRNNYGKRFLANLQLSFATINSMNFPDDLLFSGGIRATLFDSKDIIFDEQLGKDIDTALLSGFSDSGEPGPTNNNQGIVVDNPSLKNAYLNAKTRYMEKEGGSLALGYAIAGRAKDNSFKTDSIVTYRHQAWLVGQYDLGKSEMSINAMVMYRYDQTPQTNNNDGLISGIALRKYGQKLILSAEIYHNSMTESIDFGGYAEAYLIPSITLFVSLKKEVNSVTGDEDVVLKPGIKWNFSEAKK
ncbi:hypothetical protein [Aquimarina sp. RZ0]|uniref:hypothetical protein n=1 Tax=Aquimarina sp. RZ0 TaxID=2607730 RepID=UPI0011F360BC|nr:hypothetical protein [Aquimarina sp. RZ0]KAA1244579.1 hypothetical protein F0000_15765 [Aquimarina sp. RZ0]